MIALFPGGYGLCGTAREAGAPRVMPDSKFRYPPGFIIIGIVK